jgi:hypothetical protein
MAKTRAARSPGKNWRSPAPGDDASQAPPTDAPTHTVTCIDAPMQAVTKDMPTITGQTVQDSKRGKGISGGWAPLRAIDRTMAVDALRQVQGSACPVLVWVEEGS